MMKRMLINGRCCGALAAITRKKTYFNHNFPQKISKPLLWIGFCQVRSFHASPRSAAPVITPFILADIGEGITEVQIIQWFIKEGDKISQFDKIAEVQSDKAAVEITSRYDGIVKKLYYKVDETAKVGQPLIDIESESSDSIKPASSNSIKEAASNPSKEAASSNSTKEAASNPIKHQDSSSTTVEHENNQEILTTPAVRRIAKEANVNLANVKGSGKDGRIMKEDILAHISGTNSKTVSSTPVATPASKLVTSAKVSTIPFNAIQRGMTKSMTLSLQIPHFGYADEIMVDRLIETRSRIISHLKQQSSKSPDSETLPKISFMPFFVKAASIALSKYPILNSSANFSESVIDLKGFHNIGVAMDTPLGLIVPNIKNVQDKGILEIAQELNRLQDLASRGRLGSQDLQGGTFTLSNIGSIGGTYTKPTLSPPEVCIGALGKIQRVPRYPSSTSDTPVPTSLVQVSWSADHRVIDGATVARFSNHFKSLIESPELFLIYH